ncbi:aldo/keto reductase [Lentzea sp. NBRC 105346]|nr:aldo/keto reductase [Lentzea sp. NBRC 105346]
MSALGVGTWAMGGPWWGGDQPLGWGPADDAESVRALRRAFEMGVTLYDTADTYGCGHAETVLGEALRDVRDDVVIASKWGYTFDAGTKQATGEDASPEYLRSAVEASLRRLGTDRIDVYQLHLTNLEFPLALELRDACEELVAAGKIRWYGWSTDDPARAAFFATGEHCTVVQARLNVMEDAPAMIAVAEEHDLAVLCRSPLAMGLLARESFDLPRDDVRALAPEWMEYFVDGQPSPAFFSAREALRSSLTAGGRTLAQGALAWLWDRSPRLLPIPGCRTVAQVEENVSPLLAARTDPS